MTSIFVTHDQTEANALADRIAVMEGGVLQQFASQHELKERPANLFVATFIGEPPMNVFDAAVEQADGGIRLRGRRRTGASTIRRRRVRPAVRGSASATARRVVIGIRPARDRSSAAAELRAQVVSNQWLGDQTPCRGRRRRQAAGRGRRMQRVAGARRRERCRFDVARAGPAYLRSPTRRRHSHTEASPAHDARSSSSASMPAPR